MYAVVHVIRGECALELVDKLPAVQAYVEADMLRTPVQAIEVLIEEKQLSPVQADASDLPPILFEVTPLFGYDEDSFAACWQALTPKPSIVNGTVL